jgi:hemolysin III
MNTRVSPWEEVANAMSHGLGLVASIAALPLLIMLGLRRGDPLAAIGAAVFAVSLLLVYVTSTVYHALPVGRAKELWRRLDHAAIYVLIAGTYTPFMLGVLRGPLGWKLLFIVWSAALVGATLKIIFGAARLMPLSTATYLALGWMAVVAFEPLLARVGWHGLAWLLGGGVAYTVGVVFFSCDERMRFGHCVWHFFVLGGSLCHAVAVAMYALNVPR